ncbi:competence/damage-inducible protein A [Chlorobium limicola]|uniref:CinA-like protein n=1 Tax=Chlorobium limicola TaxID=1092 RepID=A0A101JR31_CHLLI|nr:competence/damage-inducible protein A [Chlorobium limicola]KUL31396.1 damage-inducible protein CinA [Chlorobium limicola]
MIAEIVSIGDELLKGGKVNTNASFIAAALGGIGVPVIRIVACSDDEDQIITVLSESLSRADLVLVTGGLGPTRDDRTKKAVMRLLQRSVVENEEAFHMLASWFTVRGRTLPDNLRDQATIIEGSVLVPNSVGTAAGMIISCGERFGNRCLVLMPGVPAEMQEMMRKTVIPFFAGQSTTAILHTPVKTVGIGESALADLIAAEEDALPEGTTLAYLPHTAGVDLVVSTVGSITEAVERDNRRVVDAILSRAGRFIYATGDTTLEETVGRLLAENSLSIAVAESCTGGLLASRLTDVPGSSAYFQQGVVSYSNDAKVELLGVNRMTLEAFGAVSEPVAKEMARGALERSGADIAVSTTGIAGPSGGSEDKPVGTLCIGIAGKKSDGSIAFRTGTFRMAGTRTQNKQRFSEAALREAWTYLQEVVGPVRVTG